MARVRNEDENRKLSNRLIWQMKKNELLNWQLAEKISEILGTEVPATRISEWRNGTKPNKKVLEALSLVFDVSLEYWTSDSVIEDWSWISTNDDVKNFEINMQKITKRFLEVSKLPDDNELKQKYMIAYSAWINVWNEDPE